MSASKAPPRVLVLAGLALVLGLLDAAAIGVDRARDAGRTPVAGSLVTFNPTAVHKVTLTRAGRTPLVLERTPAGWVVASHRGYPARGPRVEGILGRLAAWRRDRVAGDLASHAKFGVVPESAAVVKLEAEKGVPIGEIAVGTLTGVDSEAARAQSGHVDPNAIGRCVRVLPEEQVYVVQDFVTGELEPEPTEWLERPSVGGDDTRARALQVVHQRGEVGPPAWAVHLDEKDPRLADGRPIDLEKARPLARDVAGLVPTDVVANDDDPRLGLAAPRATIDLVLEGSPVPLRLLVGEEVAGAGSATYPGLSPPAAEKWGPLVAVRISGRPAPVLVQASSLQRVLDQRGDALVLTHALAPRPEGVTRVELTRDGRTVALAQEGADWTVAEVGSSAAPRKIASEAAAALRTRVLQAATGGLAVQGFERAPGPQAPLPHGLAAPTLKLVLEVGRTGRRELLLGAPEGDRVWAKRPDGTALLALPAASVQELVSAFETLPIN